MRQTNAEPYFSTFADGIDCSECAMLERKIDRLEAELEKLRTIVDKLPKTADGVPVVPEQRVWRDGHEYRVGCVWGHSILLGEDLLSGQTVKVEVPAGGCYSTREAAEAAGGKQG